MREPTQQWAKIFALSLMTTIQLRQMTDTQLAAHANAMADRCRENSFDGDKAFMEAINELSRREQAGEVPLAY